MAIWLGSAVVAIGVILLAVLLACLALPLDLADRIAIGAAIGTSLDGLVAAWLTVHTPGNPAAGDALQAKNALVGKRGSSVTSGKQPPNSQPLAAAGHSGSSPSRLSLADLSRLTDLLLDVREIRSPGQWQLFLDALPGSVAHSTPRQMSGRTEVIALLRTCEDYLSAWNAVDEAVNLMAANSSTALRFSQELRRLGLVEENPAGNS